MAALEPSEPADEMRQGPLMDCPKRRTTSLARRVEEGGRFCLTLSEAPDFLRDNDLIVSGYRPQLTLRRALGSFFAVHNETGNILSHFFFAQLVLALTAWFAASRAEPGGPPKWPGLAYGACVYVNLTLSWWAHLTCPIGPRYARAAWRLDYLGITACITGHYIPIVFYLFRAEPLRVRLLYGVPAACASAALVALIGATRFGETGSRLRTARTVAFALFGGATSAAVVHGSFLARREPGDWLLRAGLGCLALDVVLNACASVVFGYRFPERFFPRRFDVLGNSHNLMHCLVASGFTSFCVGSWFLWRWQGFRA